MMEVEAISKILEAYPATIAAIAAGIAAIGTVIAFWSNLQNRRQYKDSIQPQLSMSLFEVDYHLYLEIKNTGGLPANNIQIKVKKIRNNGCRNELTLDPLFGMPFELYPCEKVQGGVAIYGASMVSPAFPQIDIDVEYTYSGRIRKVEYSRTVTYACMCSEKVYADVNLDTNEQNQALRTTARAAVRIANYLDGRQVASFDELEILANRSLKDDLANIQLETDNNILSRDETISEAQRNRRPPKVNGRSDVKKSESELTKKEEQT